MFGILLDIECSSKIVMKRLITKLIPIEDNVVQWNTQAVNITTNMNDQIDFTLPDFCATKIVTWSCHVDDSAKIRYNIISCRDIIT